MCVWQKARVRKEEGVIKYERGTKVEGTCSIKKFKNIIARKNDILFIFIILFCITSQGLHFFDTPCCSSTHSVTLHLEHISCVVFVKHF